MQQPNLPPPHTHHTLFCNAAMGLVQDQMTNLPGPGIPGWTDHS